MTLHQTKSHTGKKRPLPMPQPFATELGRTNCSLFAHANATALYYGIDPTSCVFNQEKMREHFWYCLSNRRMELFPLQRKQWAIPQPVKDEKFHVYCCCHPPWDRHHVDDDMTMCNNCREWFHEARVQQQIKAGLQKLQELALWS